MAVLGHTGSQTSQLMHSSVIIKDMLRHSHFFIQNIPANMNRHVNQDALVICLILILMLSPPAPAQMRTHLHRAMQSPAPGWTKYTYNFQPALKKYFQYRNSNACSCSPIEIRNQNRSPSSIPAISH